MLDPMETGRASTGGHLCHCRSNSRRSILREHGDGLIPNWRVPSQNGGRTVGMQNVVCPNCGRCGCGAAWVSAISSRERPRITVGGVGALGRDVRSRSPPLVVLRKRLTTYSPRPPSEHAEDRSHDGDLRGLGAIILAVEWDACSFHRIPTSRTPVALRSSVTVTDAALTTVRLAISISVGMQLTSHPGFVAPPRGFVRLRMHHR